MPTYIQPQKKSQKARVQSAYPWRVIFISCFSVILAAVLMIGGNWTWNWMQKPTSFPVKNIQLQGSLTHVSPAIIQKIVQTRLTGGFFSLHISAAKQAILAFPWIADVSFRRVFPDTLMVRLHEQKPTARFGKKGVLNSAGVIFYPDEKTIPQNLPELDGPVDQSQALFSFYQTANTLVKLLGLSVIALQVNAENSWKITLSNHVQVNIGRHDVLSRLKQFVVIYPKIVALSNRIMLVVDLRYVNGVAVQYSDQETGIKNQ